ncbi:MAG: hypothetical protein JSR27_07695 [Proteobacteria bacterium]|nr:hypothetical protein [Pseudomonadota bacterium]
MKRLLCILALLTLGGCVETRFESPLGGKLESCDARWKGVWTPAPPEAQDAGFFVDADCRFFVIDQPARDKPVRRVEVPLRYTQVGGQDYLVVADTALKDLVEIHAPPGIEPAPAQSYFFIRYRIDGDRIDLTQVNSERVAQLVETGKLDGTVSRANKELHVYVRGDAARMLKIVSDEPIFDGSVPTHLARSALSADAFERKLARPRGH